MRLLSLLAVALLARAAGAGTWTEIEKEASRTAALRDARAADKDRLRAEAMAAAERVAGLRTASAESARAGGELSARLRDFDRVALRLEKLERELAALDARLARLAADFEAAADLAEQRLEDRARREGATVVSGELESLRAARRRLAALVARPAFRPPLDVRLSALDGPAELEAKLALIEGERARVAARLDEGKREETLLATRIAAKREWARQLAAARRDAAGSVDLIDRGYDDAQAALRDLTERAAALKRERAALEEAEATLQRRRAEAEARLAELRKGR